MTKNAVDVRSLPQTMNIANSSTIWFKMTGESLKSVSQTILEYQRNVSASLLNNWDTVKSVHDGYHAVSQTRTNSVDWNAASNFCSAIVMKETTFLWILWRGTKRGSIITTRKRKGRAWNIDIRNLLRRKSSKHNHLQKKFFWLCFGMPNEFMWPIFWNEGQR